ncbi:MAG: hypothetical protein ACE361_05645 [Aureliella sp.]
MDAPRCCAADGDLYFFKDAPVDDAFQRALDQTQVLGMLSA